MEELKTLAKGYFWESLFYGLSKIVSFVYSVIIAYLFLKDEIGLFYFSLSVIYVVSALKDFGLGASLYRNIPYLLGKKGFIDILKIIRISFSIGIMLSLIIFFIFYNFSSLVAIMINNPSSAEIIKFVAFLIILFEVFELTKYSILGFLDFKKGAFLDFFQSLMKLIGTVFFYSLYGNSIFVLVYGFIFSYIPSSLLGLFFLFSKTEFVKQQALQLNQIQSQIKFYELFAYGFTLTIVNSLFVIQQSVDKIMLAYFIQDAFSLIGIYTIVQTLSSAVVLLPYLIAIVSLPIMSSMYGANRNEELKDYIQNSFGILLIILLPAISFLLVFSETLIQLFYGRSFLLGNDAFVILIIANSIYASTSIFSQYLISTRKLLDELKFASINVFSNVIANAVLIPSYGIVGAALGTLLSSITMFVAIYIFISKQLNFTIEKRFVKMGIAAIISIIILIVVKDLLFDFIYVIMDSITNTYIPNESALIKIFLTRMIKLFILGLFFIISYLVFLFVGLLFKIYNQNDIKLSNLILSKGISIISSLPKFKKQIQITQNSKQILFLGTGFHYAHTILIDELRKHVPVNVIKYRPATFEDSLPIKILKVIKGVIFLPYADIYICESNFYYPVLNKLLFFWRKKPLIININASPIFYKYVKSENTILRNLFIFLVKLVDCQICVGKFYSDTLKEIGYTGHVLIYYPSVREEIIKLAEEYNKKFQKKNNKFITVVTNDWHIKGLDITLKIFDKISEKIDCELYVVGKFNIEKFPEFKIKRKNVIYKGFISNEELASLFHSCCINLQVSRADPFPLTPLETMLFGVIPIVSEQSGISEIVKEVDFLLVVDYSDIVKIVNLVFNLLQDEKIREEYSRKSINVVYNYQEKKTNLSLVVNDLINYLKQH